jgi:HlyD family secretion protein
VKKFLRRLPMLLFLLVIVAGLLYGFRPRPAPVDLAAVSRGPLRLTVDQLGKTRLKQRYVVTAPVGGRLQRVLFKPGADLETLLKDDRPLTWIEPGMPTLLDARARGEARATESAAKAQLKEAQEREEEARKKEAYARSDYERIRKASLGGGSSRQELDDAIFKVRSAEHDLAAKRFGVQVADYKLEQARAVLKPFVSPGEKELIPILTPIKKGRVMRVFQESETVVAPGAQIVEVGDPESIEAEIDVLTTDAVKIRSGATAYLEHWGGDRPLKGYVRLTEPAGFTKVSALGVEEQRVNVIIEFAVPKVYHGQVLDGYRVEARIVIWESDNVVKVPAGALFRQDEQWAVFVVRDGRAILRPVKIDHNNGLEAEVMEGLQEGDQVVLHPGDKIKDGITVVSRKQQ